MGDDQLAGLITQRLGLDYRSRPSSPNFDQRAVWRQVIKNGLLGDLANSFLVVASPSPSQSKVTAPWDVAAYNIRPRRRAYWAETLITDFEAGRRR